MIDLRIMKNDNKTIPTVWLCNVTKIIFGGTHPPQIFVKTI
jgi:hypothetical protein